MTEQLLNANTFSHLVTTMMREKNISHIDAVLEVCKARNLDVESVPELLTPKMKKQIQAEAAGLHMIRKKKKK